MAVRVRYAPSPTGSPHVGNLRTAIFNWLFARKMGGTFVARLEDTDRDPERYRPEYIADIERSLNELGITPDEWWVSGGDYGPYVQSARLALYQGAADELLATGMAYRCYCTPERLSAMRAEQQEHGVLSGYDRRCRGLSAADRERHEKDGTPSTVRLAVPLDGQTTYTDLVYGTITFENRLVDDQVLLKSNGWPTYHLAVVVDDHLMGITHVIRGEDWQPSTPKQVLLYQALGWEPPQWAHAPLILGPDRKKLSKRHGATQFVDFLSEGYLPDALFNFLVLLGWSAGEENRELFFERAQIVERFSLEGISKNAAIFDYDKLKWMNGEYIRAAEPARLGRLCVPYLTHAGLMTDPPTPRQHKIAEAVVPLIADRMKLLSEAPDMCDFFFRAPTEPEEKGRRKWLSSPQAVLILDAVSEALRSASGELSCADVELTVDAVATRLNIERAPVIHTLRVAVTGRSVGPGLFETLSALGRDEVVARIAIAKGWVRTD